MLQHEHFALIGRQCHQRQLQRPAPLGRLGATVGAIRRRYGLGCFQRCLCPAAAPLREAAVAQDKEEPADKLVGLLTLGQLIERPDERVLYCVLPRIAVAIPFNQLGIALPIACEHRPNDFAVRLGFRAQPFLR